MSEKKSTVAKKTVKVSTASQSESAEDVVQSVLSMPSRLGETSKGFRATINGVVIGTLQRVTPAGKFEVDYRGNPAGKPIEAISTSKIIHENIGRSVALSFVAGDSTRPIILGLIEGGTDDKSATLVSDAGQPIDVSVDGERLTLSAEKEIVIRCGQSSITLTRAGKIIVKGTYVSTHSAGVNRIKGGSVQVN